MALSTDISRGTTNVSNLLPADVSQEIQARMLDASVIQQLARQVSVPGSGLTIPVISGEPTASWVAEGAEKPTSRHTLNKLSLTPKKLAVIEPFSDEFRRDLPGLYAELVRRLPNSLGKKFDQEAITGDRTQIGSLYDEGEAAATNADLQTVDATDTYGDVLAAITKVATNGYEATGVAVSPAGEALLMGAVSGLGLPIFMPNATTQGGSVGNVFGRPVYRSRRVTFAATDADLDADGSGGGTTEVDTLYGIVGQWDQAIWGTVEGIKVSFSDQATLTDGGEALNLWQRNMFAVRAEIEIGFVVADPKAFVFMTDAPAATD
jgi:HK97 family phage major capsid protein